ncbi:hypothetical protein AJ85_17030 [Alkalihalobacillus alcalophilus ATCC 27647 = CGMCC 1.3604]|uniref:Flagellin n=1 Tax=Alkalihalobacillus alcalophilus ATCC 27647 = CGMCC 1.3604 TaxID=1218173 RepID=A0A4S4JXQ0_ALKAL|nr:flagellin [Alkalihalobacillus alcalophilus]MED1561521.1 flagellin [Alkalihalobacillus alcalophilus]THG89530.1 hypothetical protein AJ85_17030 [Alkalihalobacillus alcalophilus ATCC 27647 = CGMCC 1.3604]
MIINNNIPAMNTYRQMGINQAAGQNSMSKLATGLRINQAADDAAGLSISEKMRAQIRGLDQASRNAQDGISMIQTAEGALQETHNILQRMRELATQASNDTNVEVDRNAIQDEINQLKEEIDRIGNTTEFNTQKLVDGSIGAKKAPGVDNAAVLTEGLGKATAAKLAGAVDFNDGTAKISDVTSAINDATQTITVDGAKIDFNVTQSGLQATAGDTTGASFATYLQSQINEGIDAYNSKYGTDVKHVSVTAADDQISIESGSTGANSGVATTVATTGANNLWEIAGLDVSSATTHSVSGTDGQFTTAGAANVAAINGTEVAEGTLTFTDGHELTITGTTAAGEKGNIDIATTVGDGAAPTASIIDGVLTIAMGTEASNNTVTDIESLVQGLGTIDGVDYSEFTVTGTGDFVTATGVTAAAQTGAMTGGGNANADTSVVTIDGKAINVTWGAVGSNDPSQGDSMNSYAQHIQNDINAAIASYNETVPASERVNNVTVSVQDGAFVVQSGSDKATSSIKFDNSEASQLLGLANQSSATQGGGVSFQIGANQGQTIKLTIEDMRADALGVADVDLSTREGAEAAITSINNAIESVSKQRSSLGAVQNRLEHTISNLNNSAENLQAAESRIRDVDMAREVMEMTKNNILSQASQAMLAQANQAPQAVLQLLG